MTEEIVVPDKLVHLDAHRNPAARKTIESRRQTVSEDQMQEPVIQISEIELEEFLQATPATTMLETAAKAKYLIQLFSASDGAHSPQRQALIDSTLHEIDKFFD